MVTQLKRKGLNKGTFSVDHATSSRQQLQPYVVNCAYLFIFCKDALDRADKIQVPLERMESSECAQLNSLEHLKQCIESEDVVSNRDDISFFFSMAAKKYPNKACNLFMRAIEKLLKAKASPIVEISLLFAFLTANENQVAVEHVLTTKLPQKYSQIEYYLRIYTLRALGTDRSLTISAEDLKKIAGDKDIGKVAVIDFIITRSQPRQDQVSLLLDLKNTIIKPEGLGITRGLAIDKICAKSGMNSKSINSTLDWNKLDNLKCMVAHWDQLKQSDPDHLRKWCKLILTKSDDFCASRLRSLSKALVNLGNVLKNNAIVVELWSTAIELEAKLPAPTSEIFNKTWRLCLSTRLHPEADCQSIILGLKLCLEHLGVDPNLDKLSEEDFQTFTGVASALLHTNSWLQLLPHLQSNIERKLPHAKAIVWLLFNTITLEDDPDHRFMDGIMTSIQNLEPSFKIELEQIYCCALGTCFDETGLLEFLHSLAAESDLKNITLSLLARSHIRRNPYAAYRFCTELTKVDNIALEVILEGGFVDLATRFGVDYRSLYPEVSIQTILISIEKVKAQKDPIKMLDYLFGSSFTLFYNGCHQDALRIINHAIKSTQSTLKASNVRSRALLLLKEEFLNLIGSESSKPADHTHDAAKIQIGQPEQQFLESVARLLIDPWLARCRIPNYVYFRTNANQLVKTLQDGILWSTLLNSVLTEPPIIHLKCHKSQEKNNSLCSIIKKTKDSASRISELSWMARKQLMQELRLIKLIENQLPVTQKDIEPSLTVLPFDVSQHRMLEANRKFHASHYLPTAAQWNFKDFFCICLEIDEVGALLLTRVEGNKSIGSLRLPLGRRDRHENICNEGSYEQFENICRDTKDFKAFSKNLDQLVDQSMKIPTHDAKNFWIAQKQINDEMQRLISEQEKAWFGGFTGIISASSKELCCDHLLVKKAQSIFAAHLEFPIPNAQWDIDPLYISLLRIALGRGNLSEIEDVVMTIIESMNFRGLSIDLHELNVVQLIQDLKMLLLETERLEPEPAEVGRRLILVCDKSAIQVPWEMFPTIRQNKFNVTRALSLEQVAEWCDAVKSTDPQPMSEKAKVTSCSFLVDPEGDLPQSHKTFDEDFRRRDWRGTYSQKPSEDELCSAIVNSESFIYVGHGSGKNYIRGSELRRYYRRQTAVFLFGCNSLRVADPLLDDDALTDYSVMGSSIIMGMLWSVKDKDINRFSLEFLSRIFDYKQSLGTALRESREACVLSYLTGGAPVSYGLP